MLRIKRVLIYNFKALWLLIPLDSRSEVIHNKIIGWTGWLKATEACTVMLFRKENPNQGVRSPALCGVCFGKCAPCVSSASAVAYTTLPFIIASMPYHPHTLGFFSHRVLTIFLHLSLILTEKNHSHNIDNPPFLLKLHHSLVHRNWCKICTQKIIYDWMSRGQLINIFVRALNISCFI